MPCEQQVLGKYIIGPDYRDYDNPKCPPGFAQVGRLGAGIDGCGIGGCDLDKSSFQSITACSVLCKETTGCATFSFFTRADGTPECNGYTGTAITVTSSEGAQEKRIVCTKVDDAATHLSLNSEATFATMGKSLVQDDSWYPACPINATVFGLTLGGFCCTGTCTHGKEGKASDDVICAIGSNSQPLFWGGDSVDHCSEYQSDKFAMWAYGASEGEIFNDRSNYIIKADVSFQGEAAGITFRQQSSTDPTAPRLELKFQGGTSTQKSATLSCFDGSTEIKDLIPTPGCCQICNIGKACGDICVDEDSVCLEPAGCACDVDGAGPSVVSLLFEAGSLLGIISSTPADQDALTAAVDAALAKADSCRVENPDLTGFNRRTLCGVSGASNIGYKITATFMAPVTGDYSFDFNVDFGWGGVVFFDGEVSTKGYQAANMWWSNQFDIPQALDVTQTLEKGQHTMVVYGAEGCCDGAGNIRFRTPLDNKCTQTTHFTPFTPAVQGTCQGVNQPHGDGGCNSQCWPLPYYDSDIGCFSNEVLARAELADCEGDWHMLTIDELEDIEPFIPLPLEENIQYAVQIRVENNQVDVMIDNQAYATWTTDCSAFGGIGLQTWKASMNVRNLEWSYLGGVSEMFGDYTGYFQGGSDWKMFIDGALTKSGDAKSQAEVVLNPSSKVIAIELKPSSLAATVTCAFTIDNGVNFAKYNGKTMQLSGRKPDWPDPKIFTFIDAGSSAFLEIKGSEYANCDGCACSGLGLTCTASDPASAWHGFKSDTLHWAALGMDDDKFDECGPGQCAKSTVCTSSSGFKLIGGYGPYEKIWPANGKKWALFRGSPYMDPTVAVPEESVFALALSTKYDVEKYPDCKPGCLHPKMLGEYEGRQIEGTVYHVKAECAGECYAAHSTPWSTKCEVDYAHGCHACPECQPGTIFVTKETHNGDFGGYAGAADFCALEAAKGTGLPKTWCAMLNYNSCYSNTPNTYPELYQPDGSPGGPTTVSMDQFGDVFEGTFWSGLGRTCDDWSTSEKTTKAETGRVNEDLSAQFRVYNKKMRQASSYRLRVNASSYHFQRDPRKRRRVPASYFQLQGLSQEHQ